MTTTCSSLREPNLSVLARGLRLPHDCAFHVAADLGEVEVRCDSLAHGSVVVPAQHELVGLVLPGDAVVVEHERESPLHRVGERGDVSRRHRPSGTRRFETKPGPITGPAR